MSDENQPGPGTPSRLPPLEGCGILPRGEPARTLVAEPIHYGTPNDFVADDGRERRFFVRVYLLMVAGLLVSAAVAYWMVTRVRVQEDVVENELAFQALLAFEIVSAGVLARFVPRLGLAGAAAIFFGYAAFNGVSFSFFLMFVPPDALAYGFVICAALFGLMAVFGQYSQRQPGSGYALCVMFGGGIALVVAANLLRGSSVAYWATSYLGVITFSCLTATHVQNLRDLALEFDDDPQQWKAPVCGALLLYLDLVNLYLIVVRTLGLARSRRQ